jgi:predicted RND superfamily exporter protein
VRRYFRFVVHHPVPVLILGAVLALAIGSGAFRLTRNTSPDAFIPPRHPALAAKQRVDALFGLTEPIAVAVVRDAPGGIFNPLTLALIRDLTQAIRKLPHVGPADVLSLATESGVYFDANGEPGFDRLMKQVPADRAGCEALKQDVLGYKLYKGTLVAADGSAACILIRLRNESHADQIYQSLRELLAHFPVNDERLVVAGEAAVRARMGNAVSDDALRMNFFVPLIMVLLIVLAYRTVRGTLLPLCVIGAASAIALGLMGFAGVPVYIVTNGIFVVIMALSVSYSLNLLGQYYEEQLDLRGRSRQEVIADACTTLFFPVLVTSTTDFTGFLAFYFTGGMPPIMYFGLFTCAGVLAALAYAFTVLPAGLAILPLKISRACARPNQPAALDAIGAALGRMGAFIFRRRLAVLLAGAVLIVLGSWGASKLIVNDARILAFKDRHPLVQAAKTLNARFDGISQLNIVLSASAKGALLQPDVLRKIDALEAFTETLPHVGGTHSVASWVKRAHQKLHQDKPEYYAIPADASDAKYYLDTLGAPTCPMSSLLRKVVDPSYTAANLIVRMRSSEYVHEREVIRAIEQYLAEHFPAPAWKTELAGRVNLDYEWLRMIKTSHILGVAFSALCTLVQTALMFRSLLAGVLCTLTVGFVCLVDYAVMGLSGVPLGVGTSMFASIAIGVGVNPAIHILDRLRQKLRQPEADPERVFSEALAFTGRRLFFAAFVLVVGFGLLCLSEFRTLVEFGLLIGLAIGTAFVVSVTLLPALVAAWKPRFIWGPANVQLPTSKIKQPVLLALLLAAPVACFAQAPDSTPRKPDPVDLSAMEAAMKKSLDTFRLPSEYRSLCAARQQHDRAIIFFRDLATAQPESWRAHLELSCAYVDKIPACKGVTALISQGALAAKAIEQADLVVSNRPNLWVSYYARGLNHLNWPRAFRHSDDAIKDLTRCLEIQQQHGGQAGKPCYLRGHVALGDAYTKAGKYHEARQAWQRGLHAFPQANELKARLDTKDDNAQLAYVESQRSLDKPVDTSLTFLDD